MYLAGIVTPWQTNSSTAHDSIFDTSYLRMYVCMYVRMYVPNSSIAHDRGVQACTYAIVFFLIVDLDAVGAQRLPSQ